ncbi:PIG-L family deacetylase [Halopseudomonas nanhaiensis]|uniref:PIG-L deacetylase family protein n=1 Tax=Halopseudomonas nanhaiensis TaxID=2830842 RepID=UPI001CBF3E70|nr:PIG-L family deacetylase [Halopseudomonas nanhaiensis]UAW97744.1 PIG-L family deacetylase [Halopseudomonas nanhaiensis]
MKFEDIGHSGTPLHAWKSSARLASLPAVSCDELVPSHARAVVLAPHPDDEILGSGGILQLLARLKRNLMLISVTNGSASHPESTLWTSERLGIIRPQESAEALRRLGLYMNGLQWIHGGFPDNHVADRLDDLKSFLRTYLRPTDVVFTPWRGDGHVDHQAVADAALSVGMEIGAAVYEVPIWAWNWASPEDPRLPWERAHKVHLDRWTQARKRHAIQAFASQLTPDPSSGQTPPLNPATLERLQQAFEVVFL